MSPPSHKTSKRFASQTCMACAKALPAKVFEEITSSQGGGTLRRRGHSSATLPPLGPCRHRRARRHPTRGSRPPALWAASRIDRDSNVAGPAGTGLPDLAWYREGNVAAYSAWRSPLSRKSVEPPPVPRRRSLGRRPRRPTRRENAEEKRRAGLRDAHLPKEEHPLRQWRQPSGWKTAM